MYSRTAAKQKGNPTPARASPHDDMLINAATSALGPCIVCTSPRLQLQSRARQEAIGAHGQPIWLWQWDCPREQRAPRIAMLAPRSAMPTLYADINSSLVEKEWQHLNLGVNEQDMSCQVESTVARSVTEYFGGASETESAGYSSDSGDSSTTLPLPGNNCRFHRCTVANSMGTQFVAETRVERHRFHVSNENNKSRPGSESVSAVGAVGRCVRPQSRSRSPADAISLNANSV